MDTTLQVGIPSDRGVVTSNTPAIQESPDIPVDVLNYMVLYTDRVTRDELFYASRTTRHIVSPLEESDWVPFQTFIEKLSDRIDQIEDRTMKEKLTLCLTELSELNKLNASFFTKEVRFFRALLSLSPLAFDALVGHLKSTDQVAKRAYNYRFASNMPTLCNTLAKLGNLALARTIFNGCYNPNGFGTEFARALLENGDIEHAHQVFRFAPESVETLTALCKAYIKRGQIDKAVSLVQEFSALSEYEFRALYFQKLVTLLMQRNHFNEAAEVAKSIQNENVRSSSLVDMCTIYILKGRIREATPLLKTMTRGKDWPSLQAIVLQLINNNLSNAACQIAELIRDESKRDDCLYRISTKLYREHYAEAATIAAKITNREKILQEGLSSLIFLSNIQGYHQPIDQTPLHYLELLLRTHLDNGMIEEASSLITNLIEKFASPLLYPTFEGFARTLMERGYLEEAKAIVKLMPDSILAKILEYQIDIKQLTRT